MNPVTTMLIRIFLIAAVLLSACSDPTATPQLEPELDEEPRRSGKADDVTHPGSLDGYNDPGTIDPTFERRFDALPLEGKMTRTPWTDSYWPRNKGGISYRWVTDEAHDYPWLSKDEVFALSADEVAALSPAEKYDLYVGAYDFPLAKRERSRNGAHEPGWAGYCHGWTPAALHYDEPGPVTMTNPDGLEIAFGASDVKALLSLFEGEVVRTRFRRQELPFKVDTRVVGTLCGSANPADPACTDANPGAFHVVMTNLLGLRGEGFGIDATNTREKWNQPVHRFVSTVLGRRNPSAGANPKAVEEVLVRSDVTYTFEIHPTWEKTTDTELHEDVTKSYTYTVELDAGGAVVGGQWVVVFRDGSDLSITAAYEHLITVDDDGDGAPDLTEEEARSTIWAHFDYADYVWVQDKGSFSPTFEQATEWDFIVNTVPSRRKLYTYFGKLGDVYAASVKPE